MKNLKKVLALVVVFTMMLSTVAFAAYPDVAADADYATAVEVLSALKILQGDDQGNFNPDANITRAEFAAVVCRALGLEDSANGAKGATAFSDVEASHWATGYINIANQMGIINGMGDGTFAPEENVTYEQAVKMLTCALGYEYMAQKQGGWPTGYLVIANRYGVTAGVKASAGEPAARSIVAELTYNALDCPIMEQGTYGTEEYWYVYDGVTHLPKKTLLSEKLDVAKVTGVVAANSRVGFAVGTYLGGAVEDGEFAFYINEDVETKYNQKFNNGDTRTWKVADSKADTFLGNKVDAYVTEVSRNEWEALAIVPEEGKNVVTTIASSDVDKVKTDDTAAAEVIYYEEEGKVSSTKLEVPNAIVVANNVYQNGVAPNTNTITNLVAGLKAGSIGGRITAIDWENDYSYDIVLFDAYKNAIVKNVNASAGIIRTENYGNIDVKLDDDSVVVTIKDAEGNDVALEDIAEGDVLAIITDNPTALPGSFNKILDITVIPNADATITGTVTETDISSTIKVTDKVYIDGEAYGLSVIDTQSNIWGFSKIAANSVGTFYLTAEGKIIGFEGDKAASGDYAFILESGITSGGIGTGTLQMKVLTSEGEIVTYDVANNVTIPVVGNDNKTFDTTATTSDTITATVRDGSNVITTHGNFDNTAWETKSGNIRTVLGAFTTPITNVADRFVKINVTSAGKINRIEVPGLAETFAVNDAYAAANGEYKENANKVGNALLADNAVIFVLDAKDDYTASKVKTCEEAFVNENDYKGYFYDLEDGYNGAALITYSGSKLAATDGVAIVTGVTNVTTENNDKAKKIRFIQNGSTDEESILLVDGEFSDLTNYDDDVVGSAVNTNLALVSLAIGDVFTYSANSNGEAETFAKIATRTNAKYTATTYATEVADSSNSSSYAEDVVYYVDYISTITDNEHITLNGGASLYISDDANQYYFKHISSEKYDLTSGAYWMGKVDDYDAPSRSYVLVKTYEDEVIDIIALDADTRETN